MAAVTKPWEAFTQDTVSTRFIDFNYAQNSKIFIDNRMKKIDYNHKYYIFRGNISIDMGYWTHPVRSRCGIITLLPVCLLNYHLDLILISHLLVRE